jgi:TM2 domain-containing membrane protein YozV
MSTEIVRERRFNPLIAGVLSVVIPGLGQLYKGQLFRAVLWFCVVGAGYWLLVVPGIFFHLFCVLGAAFGSAGTDRFRVSR